MRWILGGAALVAATLLLLTTCSPSPESLADDGRDLPGVIQVAVRENSGSDGIPFATIPKNVSVLMEADASADDVEAVFDEYADEIDDGDVDSVVATGGAGTRRRARRCREGRKRPPEARIAGPARSAYAWTLSGSGPNGRC